MKYISLLLIISISAQAASSGNLSLSGTVALVNDISITPTASATTLNITGGESARNVAAVTETSNDSLGYKINISSVNGSKLKYGTYTISYTLSYDGGSYISVPTVATQVKNVTSLTALTVHTSQVLLNITAASTALAGTYTDTITLIIVAN